MKIYFAGSITGGRQDAALYLDIIRHLQKHGQVLTEHIGSGELTAAGEDLDPCDIHDRDVEWLLQSDVIVAEVTVRSMGVGYELGRAVEGGKNVLCLHRKVEGNKVSSMICGCKSLVIREYTDKEDAFRKIDDYFRNLSKKKVMTLVFPVKDNKVLLGRKKRGFSAGRWNGFGGKVSPGETLEFSARRELYEEAGIGAAHLKKRGCITFILDDDPVHLEVHLFSTNSFTGEPKESEEMEPQWFSFEGIPYDSMWPDDKIWLPAFLAGKDIRGECYLKDGKTITKHTIKEL